MIELNATTLLGVVLCIVGIVFLLLRGRKKDLVSIIATVLVVAAIMIVATHPTAFSNLATAWLPEAEKAESAPAKTLATPAPVGEKKVSNQASSEPAQVPEKAQLTSHPSLWSDLLDGVFRTAIVAGFFVALILVLIMLYRIRRRMTKTRRMENQLCCSICGQTHHVRLYEHRNGRNGRVKSHLCLGCAGSLHASLV